MITEEMLQHNKIHIRTVIDNLIDLIFNPSKKIETNPLNYNTSVIKDFLIYTYLFKLKINNQDYIKQKYNDYIIKFNSKNKINLEKITNIKVKNELDILFNIKEKDFKYYYNANEDVIYFSDDTWVDCKWLLSFICMFMDNPVLTNQKKDITICYTIPNKNINKLNDLSKINDFLKSFTYYKIKVKYTDKSKKVKENNILIVKNAAINYLKHLKQFKHDLETEESYKIFYNLLKNECCKQGFELVEQETNLLQLDAEYLNKIKKYLDDEFVTFQLSKQVHFIENFVWQSTNDITLLEHTNNNLDSTIDLITMLKICDKKRSYDEIRTAYHLKDLKVLLTLIIYKYLLNYDNLQDSIDYSIIDLSKIKPKYMNNMYQEKEQDLINKIKSLNIEIFSLKRSLDNYKEERAQLNKYVLGQDKYLKELERCVGNINRVSITIGRYNSKVAELSRTLEQLKKEKENKYKNVELFNYNYSIIKHICNSILGCSYYLKTNNLSNILDNIIIFEDFERTDNAFYLEVSFKDLLKISNHKVLRGIIDQIDLPKLSD